MPSFSLGKPSPIWSWEQIILFNILLEFLKDAEKGVS